MSRSCRSHHRIANQIGFFSLDKRVYSFKVNVVLTASASAIVVLAAIRLRCDSIPIDLVLGAEVYSAIIEEGLKKGNPDSPVVQKTALGWILSGSVASHSENSQVFANGLQCSVDHELSDLLQRFWLQEETKSPRKSLLSKEDAQCEQQFEETHSRTLDGRYVVRLPIKTLPEELGDSRNAAQLTLARQEKRFTGNPKLKDAYSKFLAEYESLGHMQQISPSSPEPRRVFYLPHHAVLREHSTTTKVRVVFNGSYRTDRGISVNDLQYVGPKLQLDLADVITRWRQYGYVFIADIEKMYRQIRVHPNDWDLQRILWRADPEHPLSAYHLCTVTYGLTSAPYLALRTLQQLSTDENYRFPLATEIIQSEIYVDDVLSGAHELSKAKEKLRQINDCLKVGGFVLQKWASNDDDLLSEISSEHKETSSVVSIDDESRLRTLGILWQPRSDSFLFSSPRFSEHSRLTKRAVLSKIAQLFDPLGWIAPVVISGKIFMQQLWKSALEWDEPIKGKFANDWKNYEESLNDLSQISVPRWFGPRKRDSFVEIHGFADASQAALGAVIYLRIVSDFNDIRVSLVMAKTKVAPLKKLTTPRLELSAAVLLTRQISRVREVLNLADAPTYLWTDSTVTLAYIHGDAYRWAEFVQNRVTVIKELENSRWQHVPGNQNPADLASRGVSPRQLATENLWWMGPTWLSKHSTAWPSTTPPLEPDVTFEIRKTQVNLTTQNAEIEVWNILNRFSSFRQLLRVTAWCFRAAQRFRNRENSTTSKIPLSPTELDKARLFWIKLTQKAYFDTELRQLKKNSQISRSSALIRLVPFLDDAGLIRVGGRIRQSMYSHDEKHPLILPRNSTLTTLVIDQAHRSTLHGGTQVTLATLRHRYWIVGGRVPIRAFIHNCVICIRYRAALGQQLLGQLPPSRFACVRPFLHTGVDLAGPITLRTFRGRGAKTYKGYIVVFVSFSSSAVHLELVTDYSTAAFIAAFKRFSSRRGICETMTSDCGTNFVGAATELKTLFKASSKDFAHIASVLANDGTLWKFNPPSAPHFGGKWEAAVKSVKFHIKRVIGDTGLTYEEYSTLLTQIEAVLNSRPLCALSDDPSDLSALTPGHFLIGTALNSIPEPSLIDLPSSRLSRWQLLRQMLEHFWQRWSIEYIQQLQVVSKWQNQRENFKIGALVLVKDERYPPSKWALGRIIDVHPGSDNLVRVTTVRTQNSTLKRPIVKLCALHVSASET